MKLSFISDHMRFSGGRWLMFEYAMFLRERGHEVMIAVLDEVGELAGKYPVSVLSDFSSETMPDSDLIIATSPKEVQMAWDCGRGKVVHFSQGFELTELELRIAGEVLPPRYQGGGLLKKLTVMRKKMYWKRKHKRFDEIYRLPTHLITVSSHLQKILEERYRRPVHLCRNGVDQEMFFPRENWHAESFSAERPMRILNIGPYEITYKGVQTTLRAVEMAKNDGIPIDFIRITPLPPEKEQPGLPFDYELNVQMPRDDFCELVRSCDVYISNSTEREGFGLPAIEAMTSGLICILSSISAYLNFSSRNDHCIFVPVGDANSTFEAIKRIYRMDAEELSRLRSNGLEVAQGFSHHQACLRFEEILTACNQS